MGTQLKFSFVYHLQTEMVNKSLGSFLRCLVGEHLRSWDIVLFIAEFAYNNLAIAMKPF